MCSPRHSIFCIMPPHILRAIAERGTLEERTAASRTLALDSTFRSLRATAPLLRADRAGGRRRSRRQSSARSTRRTISSSFPGRSSPAKRIRRRRTRDPAIVEAFNGLGATWDFYFEVFDRQSIDDEGMPLNATVHYGSRYNNAFWNGQQMVFGDGDGRLFNRFTIALDVIGHELTHGVTQDEAQLQYMFQSGRAQRVDVGCVRIAHQAEEERQTARTADWLIGEGLFTPAVQGKALRSMKAPGTAYSDPVLGDDPQPDHMSKYVNTYDDNGGVHINSGIPNRASIWRPTRSTATPGKRRAASGTRRCAIPRSGRIPASSDLPG